MKHTKEKKGIVSVGYLCPMRKIMKNKCFRGEKKKKTYVFGGNEGGMGRAQVRR